MKFIVWNDNLLEEFFAIEKDFIEDHKNKKFKEQLLLEKNNLNEVEADSITDAISKYKKSKEKEDIFTEDSNHKSISRKLH